MVRRSVGKDGMRAVSGWRTAIKNLQTLPQNSEVVKTTPCVYCGEGFDTPVNVTSKKYCGLRCQRDARYLREHGHRPVRRKGE